MSKFFTAGAVLALAASVQAHTYVKSITLNGKSYPGYYQGSLTDPGNQSPAWWTAQGWGMQPILGNLINTPDIIAHKNAKPSPYTVEAAAGSPITFEWQHVGTCGNGETGWDCSHHGVSSTWLAPCNGDCAKVDKTKLQFFKIAQEGLIDYRAGRYSQGSPNEQKGYWSTDKIFYDNGNKQTITLPKNIKNGNYVLRTELISIHNNKEVANRQFWPQAFNIRVTSGNDNSQMPQGIPATQIWHPNDPLLLFDLYWHDPNTRFAGPPGPAPAFNSGAAPTTQTTPKSASSKTAHRRHSRHFSMSA